MALLEEFSPDWVGLKYPESRGGFGLGRKEGEAFQVGENISKREKQMEHNWGLDGKRLQVSPEGSGDQIELGMRRGGGGTLFWWVLRAH